MKNGRDNDCGDFHGHECIGNRNRQDQWPGGLRDRIQSIPLLGNDNLAVLVETAAGAHVVRKLDSAATGARGLSRSRDLHVSGTTGVSADTTLLLFRYGHSDLPYELSSVAITRK